MMSSEVVKWAGPIASWDEAVPLGNGLLGLLLWKGDGLIQISMDRGDLWDSRTPEAFTREDWNWTSLRSLVESGQWSEIDERFISPGQKIPYPTKLPAGRLFLSLPQGEAVSSFALDRAGAIGSAHWDGGDLEAFCPAEGSVACLRFRGTGLTWRVDPPPYGEKEDSQDDGMRGHLDLSLLGYPSASRWQSGSLSGFTQETVENGAFCVSVATLESEGWTELYVSVERGFNSAAAKSRANKLASLALANGWEKTVAAHRGEWDELRTRSLVQVPDEMLMEHYRQASYFMGSVSRPDGPPISLQAIWTADDGRLPPWKGDYHHDMNTQLSYWPHMTAGHADRMRGFLEFMKNLEPVHRELAQRFFGCNGIFVPGAMAHDGQLIGGYAQVSCSPTNGAWVAQLFHHYWKYTLDREFLETVAYPYCCGTAQLLAALLEEGSDGQLHLPLSASPEIHEGGPEGWVSGISNYDLALMRWNFSAVIEMAEELGRPAAEMAEWKKRLEMLPALAVGELTVDEVPERGTGPLLIAPGKPLHESHRHHSHLLSIYPLGLLSEEDGEEARQVIDQSFRQLDKLGTGLWAGYSFGWVACLAARCGRSERARRALRHFAESFVSSNGFHLNGDYRKSGLSWWNYRPFTLEGNFAFMEGLHEMLLQSWRGVLRIFPAVPEDWTEASFERLRAEGGLTVSAWRKEGVTVRLKVYADVDRLVKIVDPFLGQGCWSQPVRISDSSVSCQLLSGATLEGMLDE